MRLLTNPGSNLSEAMVKRYQIELLPQHIVVDSVTFDTRMAIRQEVVDEWVRTAKRWPDAVGTTAAETVSVLNALIKSGEREIALITTSKKIINSYQSAERAVRTLKENGVGTDVDVVVLDTGVTDVGALLACVYFGELMRMGLPFAQIVAHTEVMRNHIHLLFALSTLENMVKGGRASFLRAWVADVLGVGPVLGFDKGEAKLVAKYSRKLDMADRIVEQLKKTVPAGSRVWAAVMHTQDHAVTGRLRDALHKAYDVVLYTQRPIAPAVYLHAGPGGIGAAVVPLDKLPVVPPLAGTLD